MSDRAAFSDKTKSANVDVECLSARELVQLDLDPGSFPLRLAATKPGPFFYDFMLRVQPIRLSEDHRIDKEITIAIGSAHRGKYVHADVSVERSTIQLCDPKPPSFRDEISSGESFQSSVSLEGPHLRALYAIESEILENILPKFLIKDVEIKFHDILSTFAEVENPHLAALTASERIFRVSQDFILSSPESTTLFDCHYNVLAQNMQMQELSWPESDHSSPKKPLHQLFYFALPPLATPSESRIHALSPLAKCSRSWIEQTKASQLRRRGPPKLEALLQQQLQNARRFASLSPSEQEKEKRRVRNIKRRIRKRRTNDKNKVVDRSKSILPILWSRCCESLCENRTDQFHLKWSTIRSTPAVEIDDESNVTFREAWQLPAPSQAVKACQNANSPPCKMKWSIFKMKTTTAEWTPFAQWWRGEASTLESRPTYLVVPFSMAGVTAGSLRPHAWQLDFKKQADIIEDESRSQRSFEIQHESASSDDANSDLETLLHQSLNVFDTEEDNTEICR